MKSLDWMDDAKCGGMDSRIFFPHFVGDERYALDICLKCKVRAECLDYGIAYEWSLTTDSRRHGGMGVFGGTTSAERKERAKRARRAAAVAS